MKVIGIKRAERTSKTSGKPYRAVWLYVTRPFSESEHGDGVACEEIFTTENACSPDVTVGDDVRVLYNKFGKVELVDRI